jgi:putative ABC transport system permease protein
MAPVRLPNGSLRLGAAPTVARLTRGVTVDAALAELRVIAARVEEQYRGSRVKIGVRVVPLTDVVLAKVRRSLWMLFAAVGLVLAAACANVANLLLARMSARTREVVTRAALGASSHRLVRQFLSESLLLSFAGGALGVIVARVGMDLLVRIASARLPRSHEIVLDWQAFVFLFVLCLANAILFGLAPALAAARVSVDEITREGGGRSTVGGALGRLRDALVAIEVALAFVLALGAAVVIREVMRLQKVDTGMVTENVVTLHVTPKTTERDYYAIESSVAAIPGVTNAGFTQLVPLQKSGWEADFSVKNRPVDTTERRIAGLRYVTPGYFRTLGIPLLRGRSFTASDTTDSPRVIMVNDALVQRYFPGEDIVGWEFNRGTVIGIVGSVRQAALDRPSEPELYYPVAQNYTMYTELGMSLLVRTAGRPQASIDAIRSAVNRVNPRLAIFNVKTMEQVVVDSLWELNLYVWLIGLFAALTLLLTAIGLYGVISYNVTSRIREFAVRLALGSEPSAVTRLVLGRAMRLTAIGLAGGILVALSLALAFRNLPIRIGTDPVSYMTVSVVLVAVALAACLVPATRVARVNPATALRHD